MAALQQGEKRMNFAIKITYTDEKSLDIVLPEEEVSRFLETVKNGECYWDKTKQAAFWTPDSLIRYVNINKLLEDQAKPPVEEKIEEVEAIPEGEVEQSGE
jgi:hypothetical protein